MPVMDLPVDVTPAPPERRGVLARMLELYQHDLSHIWDQDLDERGEYGYTLDRYWSDAGCFPYLFLVQGQFAGFALVDRATKLPGGDFWLDQFFVMKKYRRRGIGMRAAHQVLSRHEGRWQVGQMTDNAPATAFWRSAIASFTGGRFEEHTVTDGWWQGTIQAFSVVDAAGAPSRSARPRP